MQPRRIMEQFCSRKAAIPRRGQLGSLHRATALQAFEAASEDDPEGKLRGLSVVSRTQKLAVEQSLEHNSG